MPFKDLTEKEVHRKLAINCFNATWDLIEKENRTDEDDLMMIHLAHSSQYHWRQATPDEPIKFQRGNWQIARIYTLLEHKKEALYHAKICLSLTEKHDFKDFDLAFAHECMARAYALNNNRELSEKQYKLAEEAGSKIKEQGDRDYFFKDLHSGNWFGMR
ncbi:MAG: hypothetical protein INQ03_14535 [Candidatus Heimdallarchaeota archaeon]|nr:hypothetical protein [Candidatus Heimdallarchaeota archaeon]